MRRRAADGLLAVRARSAPLTDVTELRRRLAAAQQRVATLQVALASNRRIGMAVGILMVRHRLTEDQAFELLRQYSSRTNVKPAAVADEVVHTGDLPRVPPPRQESAASDPPVSASARVATGHPVDSVSGT